MAVVDAHPESPIFAAISTILGNLTINSMLQLTRHPGSLQNHTSSPTHPLIWIRASKMHLLLGGKLKQSLFLVQSVSANLAQKYLCQMISYSASSTACRPRSFRHWTALKGRHIGGGTG